MSAVRTVNYATCKQCGRQYNVLRMLRVQGIMVHGPKRSASFSGDFCSCACLDTFLRGTALSVGRPVGDYGSEDWSGIEVRP